MTEIGHWIRLLFILFFSAICGYLLLALSYCLPSDIIKNNVSTGTETLLIQGPEYWYAEDYTETILDNHTDALMLGEAVYPSDDAFSDAVMVPHFLYHSAEDEVYSLMGYVNGDPIDGAMIFTYPRYWHGYLVFLRPLLSIMSIKGIRVLNFVIITACRNIWKHFFQLIPYLFRNFFFFKLSYTASCFNKL